MNKINCRDLSLNEIINLLNKVNYCRLGVVEDNKPYIIPMWFNYRFNKDSIKFFLHSRKTGMKIDCIKRNSNVVLEFDRNVGNAVDSVVVNGKIKVTNNICDGDEFILEVVSYNISGRRNFIKS